jgi:hypothetical protein
MWLSSALEDVAKSGHRLCILFEQSTEDPLAVAQSLLAATRLSSPEVVYFTANGILSTGQGTSGASGMHVLTHSEYEKALGQTNDVCIFSDLNHLTPVTFLSHWCYNAATLLLFRCYTCITVVSTLV